MGDQSEEGLFPVRNHITKIKHSIQKRLNDSYQSKTDIDLLNFKDQLNINDNYSINKSEFKKSLLPKLLESAALESNSRAQTSALLLLQIILFNDWKLGKSELTESSLKASLIHKLISINESTKETEIKELISSFYLLLCFVVSDDNKNVKKLLLLSDNLLIDSTIRTLENSNNETLIKDLLILFQFYVYYSKDYKTIEPIFGSLTKFLKHTDPTVISQTCYTLLVFSQAFREARIALMDSKMGKKLLDLWTDFENDEQIIKPIFGIIKSLLSRFNDYKNQFLSKELNILEMIPKLISSSTELNRIYANEIIRLISMKPTSAKHYSPTEQINTIIKFKIIESITKLLETDNSSAVKSSVLNAIFVVAYNSSLDQLKLIAEQGCLQALCSQLDSDNETHIKLIIFSMSPFLIEEFKDILKNQYLIPDPREPTTFAKIIRDCNGFNKMCEINRKRIQKENEFNKHLPEWRHKQEGYKLTDTERMLEEILVHSFGVDNRPKYRKPGMKVMAYRQSLISCCDCKNALANTDIFSCRHISYCKKCGSSAVHKIFSQEPKKCSVENCGKSIAISDTPFYLFKSKLFKEYFSQQTKLEVEIEPEFHN